MTELSKPIAGPLNLPSLQDEKERPFSGSITVGIESNLPTSVTEKGSGFQLQGMLYQIPNTRDVYSLGLQLNFDQTEGSDLNPDLKQHHSRYLLTFNRGTQTPNYTSWQNLYAGVGRAGGGGANEHSTLELGSDIFSPSFFWRMSGNAGLCFQPYLGTMASLPFDSEANKEIALIALRAGFNIGYCSFNPSTTPPPEQNSDADLAFYLFLLANRFGRNYATNKALSGPSSLVQEDQTIQQLGEGQGLPSPRQEEATFFNLVDLYSSAKSDGNELTLQLKAGDDQKFLMGLSKAIFSGAHFAIDSPSAGFAGGLELLHWGIAEGLDLHISRRRNFTSAARQEKAGNFLAARALVNALSIGIGWAASSEKYGHAFLQAGEQAMMATTLNPDPAETRWADKTFYHFVYEQTRNSGNYLGFEEIVSLPSSHLYTGARFMAQSVPGSETLQEGVDSATGRDPLYQGAKAKASASIGWQNEIGPLVLQAGGLTMLAYGGPKPIPGVGLEQKALLSIGRVEFGLGAEENLVDGKFDRSISVVAGWR